MSGKTPLNQLAVALMVTGLAACGGDSSSSGSNNTDSGNELPEGVTVPDTYSFETRLDGQSGSSVAYPGQTARLVLIKDLDTEIGTRLQAKVDDGIWDGSTQDATIRSVLELYYDDGTDTLSSTGSDDPIQAAAFPDNIEQNEYSDLSGGKNLVGKTAGEDDVTDHRDWDNGDFVGLGAASPKLLINGWFDDLVANVQEEINNPGDRQVDFSASGSGQNPVDLAIYHSKDGVDYQNLVEKFLFGAVTMSQGMDDYLDDDVDGKGLLTDNTSSDDGAPYTALEHQFDEGFGYFGAARDYMAYEDEEIAGEGGRASWDNGYHDSNGDGVIDLESEINLFNAVKAAERDLGSQSGTDFTGTIFEAFVKGRAIINNAVGRDLNQEEMDALKDQRDVIVENWEKAIAATSIHYINETLADMDDFGTSAYSYAAHAAHWSEMKGYSLGLQFNPRSPMLQDNDSDGTEDFEQFQNLLDDRPVLPDGTQGGQSADIQQYRDDLKAARDLMKQAYGFTEDDVQNW